jgi:xylose dehydrogenase (NAD/NADP)
MSAEPVRWGILSTANIARALIAGVRESEGAEVVAVGSRDRARGEAFASEQGIGRMHGSYEALLADPDVEAVYIPLPNSLHVPWSVKALEAGKHVLCEKPLTRRAAEAEAAFDAAERAGRLLMEGFMWRYHPQTARLEALVREGAVGRVRTVRTAFGFNLPGGENVRLQAALEGGALMDVGCYCVSAMRLLAGEPERVGGERVEGGDGVDVRFAGVLRFGDGVLGVLDCGMDVDKRSALEVVGDEGTLLSRDPWHGRAPDLTLHRDGAEPQRIEVEAADPYRLEVEDLSRAIREGTEPRLGRADAVGQARAIEALYRAADEGRAVEV